MTRATQKRTHKRNIIKARQRAKAQQERTGLAIGVILMLIDKWGRLWNNL